MLPQVPWCGRLTKQVSQLHLVGLMHSWKAANCTSQHALACRGVFLAEHPAWGSQSGRGKAGDGLMQLYIKFEEGTAAPGHFMSIWGSLDTSQNCSVILFLMKCLTWNAPMPDVESPLLPASAPATPTCRLRLLRHWQHGAAFQISTTLLLHLLLNIQEHHQIPYLQHTPVELGTAAR